MTEHHPTYGCCPPSDNCPVRQARRRQVLGDSGFRAKHIPGPLNIAAPEVATPELGPDDEIVVYCSWDSCPGRKYAYQVLKEGGYKNVRRCAGGIGRNGQVMAGLQKTNPPG